MDACQELAGLRNDGSVVPLEIRLSSIPAEHGTVALAFISDISERKQEEALRLREERFRQMAEIYARGVLLGGS